MKLYLKALPGIYKNESEIENITEIDEKKVLYEGFKMKEAVLNILSGLYNIFNFEDLFKNRHIIKSGSSVKPTSKEYTFLSPNVSFLEEPNASVLSIDSFFNCLHWRKSCYYTQY